MKRGAECEHWYVDESELIPELKSFKVIPTQGGHGRRPNGDKVDHIKETPQDVVKEAKRRLEYAAYSYGMARLAYRRMRAEDDK